MLRERSLATTPEQATANDADRVLCMFGNEESIQTSTLVQLRLCMGAGAVILSFHRREKNRSVGVEVIAYRWCRVGKSVAAAREENRIYTASK